MVRLWRSVPQRVPHRCLADTGSGGQPTTAASPTMPGLEPASFAQDAGDLHHEPKGVHPYRWLARGAAYARGDNRPATPNPL